MEINTTIRTAGFRSTPQRQELLGILSEANAFDSERLKSIFMERAHANLTTFYRVLADFSKSGLVHSFSEGGQEYYCLCSEVRQGHAPSAAYELVHCHGCGRVEDHHHVNLAPGTLSSKSETHLVECQSCTHASVSDHQH